MTTHSPMREQPTSRTNIATGTPSAYGTVEPTGLITFLEPRPERVPTQGYANDREAMRRPMSDNHTDEDVAMYVFGLIAREWNLSDTEAAALVDGLPPAWRSVKNSLDHNAGNRIADFFTKPSYLQSVWSANRTPSHQDNRIRNSADEGTPANRIGLALTDDQMTRICVLYCIYVTLQQLYQQEESANQWVRSVNINPVFGGRTPIEVMVEGGLTSILATRDYLVGIIGH